MSDPAVCRCPADGHVSRFCAIHGDAEQTLFKEAAARHPKVKQQYTKAEPAPEAAVRLVAASCIQAERLRWLWDDRIPQGMISLLVGEAGTSKSMLATDIAARASTGTLPGEFYGTPVDVAIASAEDHRAAVTVPRLVAAGADPDRVHFIETFTDDEPDDITLDGRVAQIQTALQAQNVKLLIIDTVVAHMPMSHDSYKEQAVRAVLRPIKAMCEQIDVTVLGLMHTNRREAKDFLTRISGSGGFGASARSGLLMGTDPNEPPGSPVRILVHGKSNTGKHAPTLRMHVETRELPVDGPIINGRPTTVDVGMLVIDGESQFTAESLLGPAVGDEDRTLTDEATTFLAARLGDGRVLSATLKSEAKSEDISERTLKRAAQRMGLTMERDYTQPGNPTYWSLAQTVAKAPF